MDAILSDIHGNLEALDAVLNSARYMGADRIICLGNIVGYGPNPVECIGRLLDCDVLLAADWDVLATTADEADWAPPLVRQLQWNREQLDGRDDLKTFLRTGRATYTESGKSFYHATPRDRSDWIFPEDIYCPQRLDRFVQEAGPIAFCGNNHLAGLYQKEEQWNYYAASEIEVEWTLLHGPCICSVGSVGQPRDGDPRASFVLCDGLRVKFIRVPYNHEQTAAKIRSNPRIEDVQADRLREGF